MILLGRGVQMPGVWGVFGVLAGGCLIGQVWGDGFVVKALHWCFAALRFRPVGWGAEKAPDFILSPNSGKSIFIFSDQFCNWRTFFPMGVMVVAVFLLFCFLGLGWDSGTVKACFGVLAGACLVCFRGGVGLEWGRVGLVCCGSFFCASLILGIRDTFEL